MADGSVSKTGVAIQLTGGVVGPGGAGGAGQSSNITGTNVTRATGGSGVHVANPIPGAANSGDGGGSNSGSGVAAKSNGGSGVVILRYPDSYTITIGAGLTGSTTPSGNKKVTTITLGTGNVSFA